MGDEMKFADSVWHRVVVAIQEAMLQGVDVSDILRQVRVVPDDTDPHVLVLSPAYQAQVKQMHTKMLEQARELQGQQTGNRFIVPGTDGSSN